jgi:hypothetical protein
MLVYSAKDEVAEKGMSHRVVLTLLKGLKNQGIKVHTDNFNTSPDSLCHLHGQKVYGCWAVRVNRKSFLKTSYLCPTLRKRVLNKGLLIMRLAYLYTSDLVMTLLVYGVLMFVGYLWFFGFANTWLEVSFVFVSVARIITLVTGVGWLTASLK